MSNPLPPDPKTLMMGGGGAPSASFPSIGTVRGGEIIAPAPVTQHSKAFQTNKLEYWDDGSPIWVVVVTVQTTDRDPAVPDDDGKRRLFLSYRQQLAVTEAVRTAGADWLAVGGILYVRYLKDGPPAAAGMNGPKQFDAVYTPPAAAMMAGSPLPSPAAPLPMPAPPMPLPTPMAPIPSPIPTPTAMETIPAGPLASSVPMPAPMTPAAPTAAPAVTLTPEVLAAMAAAGIDTSSLIPA